MPPCFWPAKWPRRRAASSTDTEPAVVLAGSPSSCRARSMSLDCTPSSPTRSFILIFSSGMFTPLIKAVASRTARSSLAGRRAPCTGPVSGEFLFADRIGTHIPAPARSGFFRVHTQNSLRCQHMALQLGLGQATAADHAHPHRPFRPFPTVRPPGGLIFRHRRSRRFPRLPARLRAQSRPAFRSLPTCPRRGSAPQPRIQARFPPPAPGS